MAPPAPGSRDSRPLDGASRQPCLGAGGGSAPGLAIREAAARDSPGGAGGHQSSFSAAASAEVASREVSAPASRVRWTMAALVFLISVVTFVDRVNISVAARDIIPEYGLSQVQMGTIFSGFVVGYMLGFLPGGWLADRFGPRRTLTVAMLLWSTLTVGTAFAGDLFLGSAVGVVGSFVVVRLAFGMAEGPAIPTANRLVASWFPTSEKGLATSMTAAGVGFGAVTGPPLVAWIMSAWGWRSVFWMTGVAGIVVALIWHRYCRDLPEQHPDVDAGELRVIRGSDSRAAGGATPAQAARPRANVWRILLGSRDVWFMVIAYALLAYIAYTFANWFYLYLVNALRFDVQAAAWLATLPFLATMICAPAGGRLSDVLSSRYGKRRGRLGVSCSTLVACGVLLYAGADASNGYAAVALLATGHGLLFATTAILWASIAEMTPEHAGAATGLLMTGGHVGAVIGPTLSPYLAHLFGWSAVFQVMALFAVVAAASMALVRPERRLT